MVKFPWRFISIVVVVLVTGIIGVAVSNLMRFNADDWVFQNLPFSEPTDIRGDIQFSRLGREIHIQSPIISWADAHFQAESISARFNLLSILFGRPTLAELNLKQPTLEWSSNTASLLTLQNLLTIPVQAIRVDDGLVLVSDVEIANLELSLLRTSAFRDFAIQGSAYVSHPQAELRVNLASQARLNAEQLTFHEASFTTSIFHPLGQGDAVGEWDSLTFNEQRQTEIEFLNWSSSWTFNDENLPAKLDWAGGITKGERVLDVWQFDTLDSAIAYHPDENKALTLAAQSNNATLRQGKLNGQIGLSLLTEFDQPSPWQSYNLVISGLNKSLFTEFKLEQPDIRLSMINEDETKQTHYWNVEMLDFSVDNHQWLLHDGHWTLEKNNTQALDFGFGDIRGDWPTMEMETPPRMAQNWMEPFDLIAQDFIELNALFTRLVSNANS